MAERIEYQGIPLPSGLPGFGGGTVQVLTLPGFNTVVAPSKFGPVVDAVNAVPPDPTPPPGSNPDNPTDDVIPPGPPPPAPGTQGSLKNFCQQCTQADDYGQNPIMMGLKQTITCVPCNSNKENDIPYYIPLPAATGQNNGVYWGDSSPAALSGQAGGSTWSLDEKELSLDSAKVSLNSSQLGIGVGEALETFYQAGPAIKAPDGKIYEPKALQVCIGEETKTWYVLAHQE